MQMYNSSKKATENTVDELTGEQLTFENVVVCFADMDAYAGDSHDVQEVQYIKGGDATSSPAAACRWAAGKRPILPTPSSFIPSPARR